MIQNLVALSQSHSFTIHGTVTDATTGEPLIGVNVIIKSNEVNTITNAYGFYSLKLKAGNYTVTFHHVSYTAIEKNIHGDTSSRLDIAMSPNTGMLREVIIENMPKKNNITSTQMSSVELNIEKVKKIPSLFGESDLLKAIQLLPGVNTANEGSTNLNVRGGRYDQNLILLDEATVYNPSHALGFFSTFNADALRSVTFYKGAFPAQYGGRLSSVVDVYMKEGNNQERSVEGGIGLIASRLTYQQPIKKGKSSILLSGRYSYAGIILNGLGTFGQSVLNLSGLNNFVARNNIHFYDLNIKANFQLSAKDKIYVSGYSGHDKFYSYQIDESNSLDWGNTTANVRWNHFFSNNLFANTSLVLSNYNYSFFSEVDAKSFIWKSTIKSIGLKSDYDWFINKNHKVKAGVSFFRINYEPGQIEQKDSISVIRSFSLEKKNSAEMAAYVSDEIKISKKISAQVGIRGTVFLNLGPGTVYSYNDDFSVILDSTVYGKNSIINNYKTLEPRFSLRYLLAGNQSIKISYAKTQQFQHLISNSSVGLPTDVWIPADSYLKPQSANQFAIGYFRNNDQKNLELSVEAYYKTLKNIIDYKDNADLFLNPKLETQVLHGEGESYGVELFISKKLGNLTGWISYTWSNTSLKIEGINNNEKFPARYDIRNNLVLTGVYSVNSKWSFAGTFKFTSGGHVTVPEGDFSYNGASYNYYSSRNGYTLPAYHRLDLSATHNSPKNIHRKVKRQWVYSIFNVYNRKNIYALFIKPDPLRIDMAKSFNFYLYGIVPSVTLNFSFK
ncbi:MAG TPA: TonB-dependent receptor [Chitinophagaceae bacterium]